MNKPKKATVVAKAATRKVRITATEAAYAKSQGIPLEELAKSKLPKRGRPIGSKNKPKDKPVDWEKLCKQLQGALAAQIKETDAYKAIVKDFESAAKPVADLSIWQRIKLAITGSY